jgi:RNA polymerase sigma factor (sigma-70 family)
MTEETRAPRVAGCLTDEALMARVGDGDASALALLFDRYKERLFGFLYRLVGERSLAEDLLGETFLRIHQHGRQFRCGSGFAPWAYRIARNLAIRELRHRAVCQRAAERLRQDVPVEEPPEAGAERSELRAVVIAALRRLPEEQRSAAILREYQGLDYHQIAAVLGCSEQAARARTYRARLSLRAALAEHMEERLG